MLASIALTGCQSTPSVLAPEIVADAAEGPVRMVTLSRLGPSRIPNVDEIDTTVTLLGANGAVVDPGEAQFVFYAYRNDSEKVEPDHTWSFTAADSRLRKVRGEPVYEFRLPIESEPGDEVSQGDYLLYCRAVTALGTFFSREFPNKSGALVTAKQNRICAVVEDHREPE